MKFVKHFINEYNLNAKRIQLIASDSGIVSQGIFQVLSPELEASWHKNKKSRTSQPF
jgi:hypothetical protein